HDHVRSYGRVWQCGYGNRKSYRAAFTKRSSRSRFWATVHGLKRLSLAGNKGQYVCRSFGSLSTGGWGSRPPPVAPAVAAKEEVSEVDTWMPRARPVVGHGRC